MTEVVVDTSVMVVVLLGEPEAEDYLRLLAEVTPLMSCATKVEFLHVATRKLGPAGAAEADGLLQDAAMRFIPFDDAQAEAALAGMLAYGRGRREPPAVLNYGDLFAYALAKATGLPLLFKGDDFAQTDIARAPLPVR